MTVDHYHCIWQLIKLADRRAEFGEERNDLSRDEFFDSSTNDHASHLKEYTETTIEFLLTEYPDSVRIPDPQGRLPLHAAAYLAAISLQTPSLEP